MRKFIERKMSAGFLAMCCVLNIFSGMTFAHAAEETEAQKIVSSSDTLNVVLANTGTTAVDISTVKDTDNGNNPYVSSTNAVGNQSGYIALSTGVSSPMNINIGETINLGNVDSNATISNNGTSAGIKSSGTYHLGYKGSYTMNMAGAKGGNATFKSCSYLGLNATGKTGSGANGSVVLLTDTLAYNETVNFSVGQKGKNTSKTGKLNGTLEFAEKEVTGASSTTYFGYVDDTCITGHGGGYVTKTDGTKEDSIVTMIAVGGYAGGMSYIKVGSDYYVAGGGGAGTVVGFYSSTHKFSNDKHYYTAARSGIKADSTNSWSDNSLALFAEQKMNNVQVPTKSALNFKFFKGAEQGNIYDVTNSVFSSAYSGLHKTGQTGTTFNSKTVYSNLPVFSCGFGRMFGGTSGKAKDSNGNVLSLTANGSLSSKTISAGGNSSNNGYAKITCNTKIVTISNPSRTGYKFNGWDCSSVNVTKKNNNGSYTFTVKKSGETITAKWTPYKLTVHYDANGGTGAPDDKKMKYDTTYKLATKDPSRTGYNFAGWTANAAWNDNDTKYSSDTRKTAQEWAAAFGKDISSSNQEITLYAQWVKTISHTFYYYNGQSEKVSVTFTQDTGDTQTITIPTAARTTNIIYNGSRDWIFRGFSNSNAANGTVNISASTTTLTVKPTDTATNNHYASYQRTVTQTFQDYGDEKYESSTKTGIAYLNYSGTEINPSFTIPAQSIMQLIETGANGQGKKETWESLGWTTGTAANAAKEYDGGYTYSTNKDAAFYGLHKKNVTITYDINGGTGLGTTRNNTTGQTISTSMSNKQFTYTRYANAVDVSKATTNTFTFAIPEWKENGEAKYIWCGWLCKKLDLDKEVETFGSYLVGTTNNNGSFTYTPLVNDTLYAYWEYPDEPGLDPNSPATIIIKAAEWTTPTSDNSTVDFDNLQNIDIDGIAKVTVKIKITNKENSSARSITVTDYFDTDKWDYYQDGINKPSVSRGSFTRSGDTITWTIPDNYISGEEMTLTYYVKIKESYWNVDADTDEYINAIKDLTSYKKELNADGSLKSTSTYQTKDKKALINLHYTINGGLLSGIPVNKYNSTPYVVMRQVNWIPTVSLEYGIGIESDTNNIYQDKSSDYKNTYFVKYDTKGSNSTFRLFELSQIRRSYSYYQITDNLMDMRTAAKNQEVIDNYLGLNNYRGNGWSDITGTKLSSGFSAKELLKVVSADNIRSGVTTNGLVYKTAALTSYDTVYATNQDGLKISIYPFIRTTNSKTGKTYETTRDTNELKNKRIDLVIDASDPIITPPDTGTDPMRTEDEDGNEWTESDGYMDINLVDNATNPSPATKTLTFNFEDKVSGINSPDADHSDWIDTSSQNVQIKLERVDNDPITIFDSGLVPSNQSEVVKVIYDDTASLRNKTGSVKVILDPTNDDILGHLKLTIRVYDNVSNYTEKTYDIYVFCLTGAVEIADTLPDYNARLLELNRFANGELGSVNVSAGGYVDRVTLDFNAYLDNLYKEEYNLRQNFIPDTATTINGDYPNTDAMNVSGTGIDSTMEYLPYEWQVRTWGYTDDMLGGLRLTEVNLEKQVYTINNSILNEHMNDLIERYQGMAQGASYEVESGSDYAIVGSTLYTYPVMSENTVTSYADKYELGGETYYDDILYPSYVTVDGSKGITINYEAVVGGYDASVERTTQIITSNWMQVGDAYLRPFMHYFYMPLEAKQKNASDPYYVTLTSYKDSEKEFVHSVTIRLSFYNDIEAIHKKLETYIKDN